MPFFRQNMLYMLRRPQPSGAADEVGALEHFCF
jgi:hypothetical protein